MFNSLTGTITAKLPQKVFIDTHGIEWDITVPDSCLDKLPPVGEVAKVYTWMQHTDVLMTLYGFATENDRMLFFDLLKVDGIGPKGAVKIMGNVSTSQLAAILDSGDLDALQKVPGVGKKTAAKMLLQLKGKLSLSEDNGTSEKGQKKTAYGAVVTALVSMGYERKSAEQAIEDIVKALEQTDDFAGKTEAEKEDILFRKAIVELAQ